MGQGRGTSLDKERLLEIIEMLPSLGTRSVKLYGGEPTLLSAFMEVLHGLVQKQIEVFVSTNELPVVGGAKLGRFSKQRRFRNESPGSDPDGKEVSMFKNVLKVTVAGVVLGAIGLALLGRTLVWQLWESGRAAVQEKAAGVVTPEIAVDTAVERTKRDLAARVVAARSAVETNTRHLETQVRTLGELEEGERLLASDLRTLAPHVLKGEACTLRGRSISKEEAKAMASRLAAKRQDYEKRLAAHRQLVEKLRQQQAQLQASLAATDDLVQQFAAKAKSAESKLALVRAAEGLEKIQAETAAASNGPVASSLDALHRTLDRRLAETQERVKLGDQLTAPDEYVQTVRDTELMAELSRLAPAASADKEKRK